jgi:hypothetical protein
MGVRQYTALAITLAGLSRGSIAQMISAGPTPPTSFGHEMLLLVIGAVLGVAATLLTDTVRSTFRRWIVRRRASIRATGHPGDAVE